ncbi:penicillin-binding protein 2 [Candidatus Saccharibacteria bacterium]|nr:penicillin-binding protein 2 [Candidatus Saccharibacteria bacterium]
MVLRLKFNSRTDIITAFLLLGIAAIIIRLFQLQIIDHQQYVLMANAEHISRLTIPARRGRIFAMDRGVPAPLVKNNLVYTVFLDPHDIARADNAEAVERIIREVAGGNITQDLREAIARTNSRYQVVAARLSRTQAEMIKAENLRGVGFHERTERVYIENSLAAQTLGFVNHEGVGQYGVEETFESRLRGRDGLLQTVTDVNQVPLTIGDNNIFRPAVHGEDIVLTIDKNIQFITERYLRAGLERLNVDRGSVIVMDPQTSAILAVANYPSYNPAEFHRVEDASLFFNPALSAPFEPGSTIKTFTIALGLDRGVITPQTTYLNRDCVPIEDRQICNAPASRGLNNQTFTMQHAFNRSLNTGMIDIAQRLDGTNNTQTITRASRDIIFDYFHDKFGFGRRTGIELYEAAGLIPRPDIPGAAVSYSNMTFGQGMNITLIQTANAFNSLINGGRFIEPSILAGTMEDDRFIPSPPRSYRQTISAETSAFMRTVLTDARSSAWFSRYDRPGFMIGGKTGTSEMLLLNEHGVLEYRMDSTIATYIGFGGDTEPRYTIMIKVYNSTPGVTLEGALAAQPIFTDISNWLIQYLNLRPRG